MGLWAKASRARRTGRGILFIGPPQLPEAHFIGNLQHRVSPDQKTRTWPFLKPVYIGSLPFTCPCGGVLGEKFHPSPSPDTIRKALLFPSRTFPRGEGGMFQAFVLFSSPRSRRPLAWRRASGSCVIGGQAEDQRPTLFTGRTHVTPDGAYLVEKPRHLARWEPRCRLSPCYARTVCA